MTDGYATWYAERLWSFLPAIYRTLDADAPGGALRELVERIGLEAAQVRRSVDRLYDNAFIETCDDWAIPYIGDLLATRLVACLDARGQRLDVARTIYYRRRAGTLTVLEELASDIAGHDARVVEFFRRLGRTRDHLDPPVGLRPGAMNAASPTPAPSVIEGLAGAFTGTPAGGFADLRNVYGAANAHGPFDEFSHTADFRRGRQSIGWHNIPRLGVFVWWLHAYPIRNATPVERSGCPGRFTFDPTGRDIPLFAGSQRSRENFGEHWIAPEEWQLPVAVGATLWDVAPSQLYPKAFSVDLGGGVAPVEAALSTLEIDPPSGRFRFTGPTPLGDIGASYHFGFSGPVGAGGFDSRILDELATPPSVVDVPATTLPAALTGLTADATVEIGDSRTYAGPASVTVPNDATLAIVAGDRKRPVLRWIAPAATWTITGGGAAGSNLILQGPLLQGADIVLKGVFDSVRLRLATLDPGSSGAAESPPAPFATAVDGVALRPTHLFIEADIEELVLERCITGPIRVRAGGSVERLRIVDSIVQSIPAADLALDIPTGEVRLVRSTVLGPTQTHRLSASESILDDIAAVDDPQRGCVRFSTYAAGSNLHAPYRCLRVPPRAPLFHTRVFGRPSYARLRRDADALIIGAEPEDSILACAENGAEPGAFCSEMVALKRRGLAQKYLEFMPIGVMPVWIDAD